MNEVDYMRITVAEALGVGLAGQQQKGRTRMDLELGKQRRAQLREGRAGSSQCFEGEGI